MKKYKRLNLQAKYDLSDMLNRYCCYGWTKTAICRKWGISIKTFYSMSEHIRLRPNFKRLNLNSITEREKQTVRWYALSHTELNHREMAYRMIDENVAFMSPSSVYRILKEYNLIGTRLKRCYLDKWNPHEPATAPDQKWQTDLMVINFQGRDYYLLSYLDVYSRFSVFHKLCVYMTGDTIRDATDEAIVTTGIIPESIQSDNGSCYISQEYRSLMNKLEVNHQLIHAHCPNENAEIERYHRTLRELVDIHEATTFSDLEELIKEQINYYNYVRYHSRIGFIPPYEKYRGNPDRIFEIREQKLEKAKANRMKINAQIKIEKAKKEQLITVAALN